MAQERPLTPEKQLLRLIEDPKTKTAVALEAQTLKHHSLSLFSFGAWTGRLSFLKDKLKKWFNKLSLRHLDVRLINSILSVCIFILVFYLVSNFLISIINLKKMPDLEFKAPEFTGLASAQESSILKKTVSYYLEKAGQRDIFKMGQKKTEADVSALVRKGPSSRIIEATQDLKLVGISWSNNPDAMIEDTKALRTFFLKRGQMIGEIRVQAIFKDKVVLSYNQEEIELR